MDKSKQAFPGEAYQDSDAIGYPTLRYPGMTLREYYAGLAMQGFLANGEGTSETAWIAAASVDFADALIARLEEGQ